MTPADAEIELERLMRLLEVATEDYAVYAREAGEAEVAYRVAHARALLGATGTVSVREAQAVVATANELLMRRIAEARAQAQREMLTTTRASIDAVRSISASQRASLT